MLMTSGVATCTARGTGLDYQWTRCVDKILDMTRYDNKTRQERKPIHYTLSTDDYGNVSSNTSFTHDMFIANIIQTLLHLNGDAWMPVDQVNNNDPDSNLKAEVKEELTGVATEEPLPPINIANQLSDKFTVPVMVSTLPPMLPRPTSHCPFAGPGFVILTIRLGRSCTTTFHTSVGIHPLMVPLLHTMLPAHQLMAP